MVQKKFGDLVMLLWQSQNTGIQQFKGPFTNYFQVGVGGPKNQLFVNFYTIENVNGGMYIGGKKKAKTCKRSF